MYSSELFVPTESRMYEVSFPVGRQNFAEILPSPIPITVSRDKWQDVAGRRLFYPVTYFYALIFSGTVAL